MSALDTASNTPLEGATILLNSTPITQRTPALLNGLEAGDYVVEVRPGEGYRNEVDSLTVNPPDTINATLLFNAPDFSPLNNTTIWMRSEDDIDSIWVLVDEVHYQGLFVPADFLLAPGSYPISVYAKGHKTIAPHIFEQEFTVRDTFTLTFDIENAEYGSGPGFLAHDFNFPTDLGDTLSLAQFRGRLVLINFWFSTCEPCEREFPAINQVYEERKAQGFRVLGIDTGYQENTPDDPRFLEYRERLELTVPLLMNTEGIEFWRDKYVLGGAAPWNFLVLGSGEIVERFASTHYDELIDIVDSYLEE
ncbi:MAG: redoxin domain-containing protein [Candidatus Electryonea clarkiae]|nr:redoxin domain-containing protein [Candidatus Electryonea clarkiae]MDP8285069.1 redoxin domain-containing protein [Candidatus Electryonea clarkiae]